MINPDKDYNAAEEEEQWRIESRSQIIEYLVCEELEYGEVGEWPAWHVAPYISIWAIENKKMPGRVGWWVIQGDLPTDYISAESINNPREALTAFSKRWFELAAFMQRGESHPAISVGSPENCREVAPLLLARAELLEEWAKNNSLWEY